MRAINKQLKILSEAEIAALYEIPDFDYEQRLEYLTLTDKELKLALSYKNLSDTAIPNIPWKPLIKGC